MNVILYHKYILIKKSRLYPVVICSLYVSAVGRIPVSQMLCPCLRVVFCLTWGLNQGWSWDRKGSSGSI